MKNANDTIGNQTEPATFRLVAQCLNHIRNRLPHTDVYLPLITQHISNCTAQKHFVAFRVSFNTQFLNRKTQIFDNGSPWAISAAFTRIFPTAMNVLQTRH
jgi:hypothetical protein